MSIQVFLMSSSVDVKSRCSCANLTVVIYDPEFRSVTAILLTPAVTDASMSVP